MIKVCSWVVTALIYLLALCESNEDLVNSHEIYNKMKWWSDYIPLNKAYIWTSDFHVSPIACDAVLLESKEINAVVHAEVDFPNCIHYPKYCMKHMKVLNFDNGRGFGFGLDPCPLLVKSRFYDAYSQDAQMWRVDLFVCHHPAANCELFLPFNRSILVHATTRIEFGRRDDAISWRKPYLNNHHGLLDGNNQPYSMSDKRWQSWVSTLQVLSQDPRHTIAANNHFDAHHIRYHTGIDAIYLPSWCGEADGENEDILSSSLSSPSYFDMFAKPYLLVPYRDNLPKRNGWKHPLLEGLLVALKQAEREQNRNSNSRVYYEEEGKVNEAENKKNVNKKGIILDKQGSSYLSFTSTLTSLQFKRMHEFYPRGFTWENLMNHPALILIPYQVSTIFFFEAYRRNIPIFAPSLSLLCAWVRKYKIMHERIYGHPIHVHHSSTEPDSPNSNENLEYWLSWCDWYQFEHVTYFDDWSHLVSLLSNFTLSDRVNIQVKMKQSNLKTKQRLVSQWRDILHRATGLEYHTTTQKGEEEEEEEEMLGKNRGSTINKVKNMHMLSTNADHRLFQRKMPKVGETYEMRIKSLYPDKPYLLDNTTDIELTIRTIGDTQPIWSVTNPPNPKQSWIQKYDQAKQFTEKACNWLKTPISPSWDNYVKQSDELKERRMEKEKRNSQELSGVSLVYDQRSSHVTFKVDQDQLKYEFNVNKSFRYVLIEGGVRCPLVAIAEIYASNNGIKLVPQKVLMSSAPDSLFYEFGSSGAFRGQQAIDDNLDTFASTNVSPNSWIEVDFGDYYHMEQLLVFNRQDCCGELLVGAIVSMS